MTSLPLCLGVYRRRRTSGAFPSCFRKADFTGMRNRQEYPSTQPVFGSASNYPCGNNKQSQQRPTPPRNKLNNICHSSYVNPSPMRNPRSIFAIHRISFPQSRLSRNSRPYASIYEELSDMAILRETIKLDRRYYMGAPLERPMRHPIYVTAACASALVFTLP